MSIIGNNKTISLLYESIGNDRLSHAYIFYGPEHIGKFTMALDLAGRLTEGHIETNPDVIIVSPVIEEKNGIRKKKSINVEDIRELQHRLSISPLGRFKLAIIDDCEYLTKASQNALLKTLEEPPAKSLLILVTSRKDKMLPTILSRCQVKKFSPVRKEEIYDMIPEGHPDRENIAYWSLGCPGLAMILLDNPEELLKRKKAISEVNDMLGGDINKKMMIAENISKDIVSLKEKMQFWLIILRGIALGERDDLPVGRERALSVTEKVENGLRIIQETNSNARMVLEGLFIQI